MDPFLGEIKAVGFPWAPRGWALCQGQLVSVAQYTALFSLIGTQFGGDGQTTFGLPDLRGRAPIGYGQGAGLQQNYPIGQKAGVETVTLTNAQMPAHTHNVMVDAFPGTTAAPQGNHFAQIEAGGDAPLSSFTSGNPTTPATLNANTLDIQGASQAHENRSPYQAVNYIIALEGIYPPRS